MSRHHPEYGVCERCPRRTDLYYCAGVDEYLCEECIDATVEAALAAALAEPSPTLDECALAAWQEHQEAHKR